VVDGPGVGEYPGDGASVGMGVGVAKPPSMTPGGGVGGVRKPVVWFFVLAKIHFGSLQHSGSLALCSRWHSGGRLAYFGHL